MNIDSIITQIRTYDGGFFQTVAGAADLSMVLSLTNTPLPSAFVVPVSIEADENENPAGYYQRVTKTFAVAIVLDNTVDERGQSSSTQAFAQAMAILNSSILGWILDPEESALGCSLRHMHLMKMDRARIIWEFAFDSEAVWDQRNAFVPPSNPLTTETTYSLSQSSGGSYTVGPYSGP